MVKRRTDRRTYERRRLLEAGTSDHYVDPVLYDFEYRERTEDIRFYRTLVSEHGATGPTLELGAGTGRISLPLAIDGRSIIALDRMAAMLRHLEEKAAAQPMSVRERIRIIQADMTAIPLADACCSLVIAPFNALMHLYRWQDLLQCFAEVRRVLVDGGRFAFDVQLPDLEWLTWDPDVRHSVTPFSHPKTGERLIYSTNHVYDPDSQICHVRIYYDEAPPRGRRFDAARPPSAPRSIVQLAHRQIFPEEVRALLAQARFVVEAHHGDFAGLPLRRGAESQVVVCRTG